MRLSQIVGNTSQRKYICSSLPAWIVFLLVFCLSSACSQNPTTSNQASSSTDQSLPVEAQVHPGAELYQRHCAACHDQSFYKAPSRGMISRLGARGILRAMNEGAMVAQAAVLDDAGRQAVAEYVSRQNLNDLPSYPTPPVCDAAHGFDATQPPVSRGWGVDERNTRFQPESGGGLNAANVSGLEVKWSFAYPNAFQARSQPVFGGGAIYVGSQDGTVWALDAKSGCVRWTFQASAEVRTGIAITPWHQDDAVVEPMIFFGDMLANVYALDAVSGRLLWRMKAHEHRDATLTGTPTYFEKRLYVSVSSLEVVAAADPNYACCTFQGAVLALEAATGEMIWQSSTVDTISKPVGVTTAGTAIMAPSGAPIWSAPTIDKKRNQLYVGTGENYSSPADGNSDAIIAFDLTTGAKRWVSQQTARDAWNVACFVMPQMNNANCPEENGPDYDFGANPVLVKLSDDTEIVVAGQKSGDVVGIDPDTGSNLWKTRIGRGGVQGGVHFGIAAQGPVVYVPINDLIFAGDDVRYNSNRAAEPGVHAVDAHTGQRIWSALSPDVCGDTAYCSPGVSQAITAITRRGYRRLSGWAYSYSRARGRARVVGA